VHLIKVEPTATPYSDGTTAETNVTSEEATPESGSGEVNIENLQQSWRAPVFFIAGLCFCCIIFGGLMRPLEFVRESEEEKKSVSQTPKVNLLGVDSLWGDCMFIPADWGSYQ
jgi:hypothetical protein